MSRDYLNMRLWDLRMENRPVATFEVHEHLRAKLCDLYESDAIFDKFQCCPGRRQARATGSHGNQFKSFDVATPKRRRVRGDERSAAVTARAAVLENGEGFRKRHLEQRFASVRLEFAAFVTEARRREIAAAAAGRSAVSQPEFNTKILHMAWHPTERVVACAASNSLYIFNA